MSRLEKDINLILAGWNPIGVDGHLAIKEYSIYVQPLISALKNDFVKDYIRDMLKNMGLEYDTKSDFLESEIQNLESLLKTVYKEHFLLP